MSKNVELKNETVILLNTYGSIRIKKASTLQSWIDKGWYQREIDNGYIFATACGRFRIGKCECSRCKKPNVGLEKKAVLKRNGFLNSTKSVLPAGYIPIETELPPLNKQVKCFMDNGTETIGYRYDNPNRNGWMTMYGDGLYANQIWSGIRVIGWQYNVSSN